MMTYKSKLYRLVLSPSFGILLMAIAVDADPEISHGVWDVERTHRISFHTTLGARN